MASEKNARIVRAAAVIRTLVADVTLASRVNDSHIILYNKQNNQYGLVIRWGMTEARNNRNEGDIPMYDKIIRLQKFRGMVNLKLNNLSLPPRVRHRELHIQAVVSYLLFILPRVTFRNLEISPYAYFDSFDQLDYAKCLLSVTRTENLSIKPDVRGTAYKVQSLLSRLEVTKSLHIEEEDTPHLAGYRLHSSDKIFLADGRFLDDSSLLSMNCVQIEIRKSRFRTEDFLEFLKAWKESNEALRRVKYVKVGHPWGVKNLYKEIGAVEWDPTKRPAGFDGGKDIFKPDGLVGTILQSEDFFWFRVWH